jgi:arylsulfatase A-like enzyme
MQRPNILILTPHDLGDFLPCYGTPVEAPNIGRIADGITFLRHFSTATVCSPARGSIVTGCYPHTNGLMGLVHRGWSLDVGRTPPLPAMLADMGYETILFGVQHEHYDSLALGYQQVGCRQNKAEEVAAAFARWAEGQASRPAGRPFLAACGFFETHRPFDRDVYRPADPARVAVPPFVPDLPEVRKDLADFYGSIRHLDDAVGVVLDALKAAGLEQNTLVVFVTDHGASLMHGKATLYDGGTKVAMLMRWPAGLRGGQRVEAVTSHVDIVPTILALLGEQAPAHTQGHSFAAAIDGRGSPARQYAFAEQNINNYYDPGRTVRSERYRYIRNGLQRCVFDFQIPEIEALTWNFRVNRQVFDFYPKRRCHEELYDLLLDPGELRNLAGDPAHAATLAGLRAALDEHMQRTDDPFRHLRNDILLPADGYVELAAHRARGV